MTESSTCTRCKKTFEYATKSYAASIPRTICAQCKHDTQPTVTPVITTDSMGTITYHYNGIPDKKPMTPTIIFKGGGWPSKTFKSGRNL